MKRGVMAIVLFSLVILFSLSFVSANAFSDFFSKLSGEDVWLSPGESICNDRLDNDGDSYFDMADSNCINIGCSGGQEIMRVISGIGEGAPSFAGVNLAKYAGCCNSGECYNANPRVGGCFDDGQIVQFPAGGGAVCSRGVWCEFGYVNDGSGRCKVPTAPTPGECVDSDGGIDYYVRGSCIDNSIGSMNDGCISGGEQEGWLREITCEDRGAGFEEC